MIIASRNMFPTRSNSSMKSSLKAYSIPIILLLAAVFFQLVVLPRHFPPSHYEVLGIPNYSSIDEVTKAYEKITAEWNSSAQDPPSDDIIKVRYAFELLTNELLKRDYDIFNIDEHVDVIEKVKEHHTGKTLSGFDLPLIKADVFEPAYQDSALINSQNFLSSFEEDKALLVQIISFGSSRCAQFSASWNRIVSLLDGVTNTGIVELGDVQLAAYLAEKKSNGQPFFRNGIPAFLAFPPGCKSSSCAYRYDGELSIDAVTDWMVTGVLGLPRILYYSKESLGPKFIAKSKPHQVKVIFLSKTGERATPFIRQAANKYSSFATYAFALWREEESTFWWNMFGVESAPAIVFLRDPGVEPVVYQGSINSSFFSEVMEKNKHHVLPQLRTVTSMELGCDVQGYSRAGSDTKIWYCAIVAGRHSQELSKMRETMRNVQKNITKDEEADVVDEDPLSFPAALALKQKRLTFAWLDGEAQNRYCFFHVNSEHGYDTCGARKGMDDVPQLFIVRYERNTDEKMESMNKQPKNIFQSAYHTESDPVSTLVAKYNGSSETTEIVQWISQIIKDGDSRELPPFRTKAPELVPEDGTQNPLSIGSQKFISSGKNMKHGIGGFVSRLSNQIGDPRIGPALLLGALMSFGLIWTNRSRVAPPGNNNESDEAKDEGRPRRRIREGNESNQLIPPSLTDEEPKDAQQIPLSDSDADD